MRVLTAVRLSKLTEQSTSPERQREVCEDYCRQRGWEPVAVCEDLDVSGAVDPFDRKGRPGLSGWLLDRPEQFDAVVSYRADRLTRSIRHLRQLVDWAEDNGKLIVSATEPHFDMSSPFAAVLVALIGTVSQFELDAISQRNASSAQYRIKSGLYRGSQPPWGYMPQQDAAGDWRLVPDPAQAGEVREVAERVLAGEPLNRIAIDFTRRGVPTPKDRFGQSRGRELKGTEWSVTPLKRALLSPALLGHAVSGGVSVRNPDGSPVIRSEPILSPEVFDRLRVELEARSSRGEPSERTQSLLLRVLRCGVCGEPGYRFNGGSHSKNPRYRCKSMVKAHKCGNGTIRADTLDADIERLILGLLGDSERREKVWTAGSDHSAELAEIDAELVDAAGLIGSPAFKAGTPQRERLDARIAALAARQELLRAEVAVPAGWAWKGTGEKFSEWWERQDVQSRNVWLRSMGVTVAFTKGTDGERFAVDLGDLQTLLDGLEPSGSAADWRDVLSHIAETTIAGVTIDGDKVTFSAPDGSTFTASLSGDVG